MSGAVTEVAGVVMAPIPVNAAWITMAGLGAFGEEVVDQEGEVVGEGEVVMEGEVVEEGLVVVPDTVIIRSAVVTPTHLSMELRIKERT